MSAPGLTASDDGSLLTANASQEAAVPHQFVQTDTGVQVNQCFNIIEECCYVVTISSALMCLYSRHVPRRRGGCCDLPGGQGSLNDNS